MATVVNLAMDQGATYSFVVGVTDLANGGPRDLSDYSGRAQMRRSYYTISNTAFDVQVTNPTQGEVTMSLSAAQTSAIKAGRYVYDLEIYNPDNGYVERVIEGLITVYPEVTK